MLDDMRAGLLAEVVILAESPELLKGYSGAQSGPRTSPYFDASDWVVVRTTEYIEHILSHDQQNSPTMRLKRLVCESHDEIWMSLGTKLSLDDPKKDVYDACRDITRSIEANRKVSTICRLAEQTAGSLLPKSQHKMIVAEIVEATFYAILKARMSTCGRLVHDTEAAFSALSLGLLPYGLDEECRTLLCLNPADLKPH